MLSDQQGCTWPRTKHPAVQHAHTHLPVTLYSVSTHSGPSEDKWSLPGEQAYGNLVIWTSAAPAGASTSARRAHPVSCTPLGPRAETFSFSVTSCLSLLLVHAIHSQSLSHQDSRGGTRPGVTAGDMHLPSCPRHWTPLPTGLRLPCSPFSLPKQRLVTQSVPSPTCENLHFQMLETNRVLASPARTLRI